jgi:Ni/Co efflux regulator RcnB
MTMYRRIVVAIALAGLLVSPVAADPPSWAGNGKGKHGKEHPQQTRGSDDRHDGRVEHKRHFSDRDRVVVRDYYQAELRGGKCPPGLGKKNNACLPPGQAKKCHVGHRLPSEIVYYELPAAVIVQLPRPSPDHRYVRVASDILLIAVGTGMVIDAIEDLGRM